jgi:hypothetical protein
MKILIVLAFLFVLIGCKKNEYLLTDLDSSQISFEELPDEVKFFFYNPDSFRKSKVFHVSFICVDSISNYNFETIKTNVGPWVSHELLNDNIANKSYRIESGTPHPIIVSNRKVYIPEKFNVLSLKEFSNVRFKCYALK